MAFRDTLQLAPLKVAFKTRIIAARIQQIARPVSADKSGKLLRGKHQTVGIHSLGHTGINLIQAQSVLAHGGLVETEEFVGPGSDAAAAVEVVADAPGKERPVVWRHTVEQQVEPFFLT